MRAAHDDEDDGLHLHRDGRSDVGCRGLRRGLRELAGRHQRQPIPVRVPRLAGMGESAVGTVPALAFAAFQGCFAVMAVALLLGAIAERVTFRAWTSRSTGRHSADLATALTSSSIGRRASSSHVAPSRGKGSTCVRSAAICWRSMGLWP